MAALCVPPTRDGVQRYFTLYPQSNLTAFGVGDFLRQLNRQLDAPWNLFWDRLQAHRGRMVRAFIASQAHICCIDSAPYAPELNPVEYLWVSPKKNPLANALHSYVHTLAAQARTCIGSVQKRPKFS